MCALNDKDALDDWHGDKGIFLLIFAILFVEFVTDRTNIILSATHCDI